MKNKGEEKRNLAELFKLIVENPEMEVIAKVDCELLSACLDNTWMIGHWDKVEVKEYYQDKHGDIWLRDIHEQLIIDEWMDNFLGAEEEDEEEIKKMIPWKKAIFVEIEP